MTSLLRNLKIGQRLALGFGLMLAMVVSMSALSLNRLSELKLSLDDIVNVRHEHAPRGPRHVRRHQPQQRLGTGPHFVHRAWPT